MTPQRSTFPIPGSTRYPIQIIAVGVAFLGASTSADASLATLTAVMTADNEFSASIGLDPTTPGPEFMGNHVPWTWMNATTGHFEFTTGGIYYLHVLAHDVDGGIAAMFLASLSLTQGAAIFSNGSLTLNSDTTHWTVHGGTTPVGLGANGTAPWGMIAGIATDAQFIWAPGVVGDVWITTEIYVLPAPSAAALLALGSIPLASLQRRRSARARR